MRPDRGVQARDGVSRLLGQLYAEAAASPAHIASP